MNSPPSLLLAVPMYITAYSSTVYQLHNIRCGTIVVFALLKCVVTPEIRQLQFVGGGEDKQTRTCCRGRCPAARFRSTGRRVASRRHSRRRSKSDENHTIAARRESHITTTKQLLLATVNLAPLPIAKCCHLVNSTS